MAAVPESEFLDAKLMAGVSQALIKEACELGNCVIVGRGSQCVLQDQANVFHLFVYAPWGRRLATIQRRVPNAKNAEELIRATDTERGEYIRLNFGCDWKDPHLYHVLMSSGLGEDAVASFVISAMGYGGEPPPE